MDSRSRSTHGGCYWQVPDWQLPPSQTIPQPPQFCSSCLVFTHMPPAPPSSAPHIKKLPGQAHAACWQICPLGHLLSHAPQLAGLLVVFTHSVGVPQAVVFGGQTQVPAVQT